MKIRSAIVLAATTAACSSSAPGMPWLHGLGDAVSSSTGVDEPPAPDDSEIAPGCSVGASRTIELSADVAPAAGKETIVASYSGGITVFDREDHLVAHTPGWPCEGSADELDTIAFGTAYGEPTLAVAATSGGHREAATWVALFRTGRTLEATFTAVVETRRDDIVKRGAIHLIPGGLLYERPGGPIRFWRLDPGAKIYVPVLPETPHGEPALSLR